MDGPDVDDDVDDEVDVDVVVERVVDVELLDDEEDELLVDDDEVLAADVLVDDDDDVDVVVAGRVVDVVVVDVEVVVVVVFFFRAVSSKPQTQPVHASPAGQSAAVSHVSPAAPSSRPSPQLDADAVNARRAVRRATSVPPSWHTSRRPSRFSRTFRSAPQAAQRARTTVTPSRFARRARAGAQSIGDRRVAGGIDDDRIEGAAGPLHERAVRQEAEVGAGGRRGLRDGGQREDDRERTADAKRRSRDARTKL